MPLHWIISFSLAAPGMLLYRAIASNWISVDDPWFRIGLQSLGILMATLGLCIFLYMSHARRRPMTDAEKESKNAKSNA